MFPSLSRIYMALIPITITHGEITLMTKEGAGVAS